jgi:hypothetical protein
MNHHAVSGDEPAEDLSDEPVAAPQRHLPHRDFSADDDISAKGLPRAEERTVGNAEHVHVLPHEEASLHPKAVAQAFPTFARLVQVDDGIDT